MSTLFFFLQGHGELQAEYLSVEHSAGLNLHDEFILVGQESQDTHRMNYSVYSLKTPEEFSKRKVNCNLHLFPLIIKILRRWSVEIL